MKSLASLFITATALAGATVAVCHGQQAPVSAPQNALLVRGRAVAQLLRTRNGNALFARFAPEMAVGLPRVETVAFVKSLPAFGAPREEWTDDGTYHARLTAPNGEEASLEVMFDGDKIAGFTVRPTPTLTATARDAVRKAGRLAVSEIAAGETDTLYARFTSGFAKKIGAKPLRELLTKAIPIPRSGATPIADAVDAGANGTWEYKAVFSAAPTHDTTVSIVFADDAARQIAGLTIRAVPTASLPPDPHAGYVPKTLLRPPFIKGEAWYVLWGGESREQNRHVDAPDQRHAYDFLITKSGKTHEGNGSENAQFFAWNKPLLAPANATILATRNDVPDNKPGVMRPDVLLGNYVLLDFGRGEYGVMAHLKRGSVAVRVGEKVRTGSLIGRCGNSGNSSQAHLHFHVQDSPRLLADAKGLPVRFTNYRANGKLITQGSPVRGETVSAP